MQKHSGRTLEMVPDLDLQVSLKHSRNVLIHALDDHGTLQSTPFFVLLRRAWNEIFVAGWNFIVLVLVLTFLPIIWMSLSLSGVLGGLPDYAGAVQVAGVLIGPLFIWTLGIPFAVMLGWKSTPLLAGDIESGWMLVIASKPVTRKQIFAAKFFAAFIYGYVLSIIAVFVTGAGSIVAVGGNIAHFAYLTPFLLVTCLYGCIAALLWSSLCTAISALVKQSRGALFITLLLLMGILIGMPILRINFSGIYLPWQIYHVDLQYHLGNSYAWLIEVTKALPRLSLWQEPLGTLAGVYSTTPWGVMNQNINFDFLEFTNNYLPPLSLAILGGLVACMLYFGFKKFRGRELA